ncbi:hypothetical protein DICPUDRAFT_154327 [Dictyostelium purpureum]|uniref:Actin-related protein 5 n=1 Tax=Dictyostelium purpureum TaxID=5786 RepID=F0ZR20_DICPU|nr:uncharacterized protein DICPUDRAFT_154327 [Dictyostelium purpureum]EGC33609.1 hypothetical protein DICPUDRAFT_154327 [Dictyostelium purpureum]|eukprot:XP_003289877.1 hypothetical protein DICPUDRAFT_154327 [Dictyostelium purpureum]
MGIVEYKEIQSPIEDQVCKEYRTKYANSPLIIDNGSYQCRAGFSIDDNPKLIFRSLVGKVKSTSNPIVGNSIKESDISRLNIKSPFDLDVLVHPPSQESILDHLFHKLGIESAIENPILMTEAASNPSFCRKYMSELLFECYNIKSVVYGIDSLFSFYGQKHQLKDGGKNALIIDSSFNTTHIYNVQDYKVSHQHTKRINIGGGLSTDYLRKVIHVKYPKHKSYFTQNYTNKIKEEHCYFTKESFIEELKEFENDKLGREKSDIIQLPYQAIDFEKLEEDKQRKLQNRKELGAKLKEMADKKRMEKRQAQEDRLQVLESILNLKLNNNIDEYNVSLKAELMGEKDLINEIEDLKEKLFGKKKEEHAEGEDEFPLLSRPDSELTQDQLKEKKKQRLLKSMKDGRLANKRKRDEEKEKEKEKEEERDRQEEEMFIKDPEQYVRDLHIRRSRIFDKKEQKQKQKTKVVVQRNSRLRSILSTTNRDDKFLGDEEVDQEEIEDTKELAVLEKLLNKFDPGWSTSTNSDDLLFGGDYPTAEDHQVILGVERIKTPEILFQPKAIVGLDQMGLMEAITSTILSQLSPESRKLVTENIFLTGGNANTKNFRDRVHYEITQLREPHSPLNVFKSNNSQLDAWFGARKWVNDNIDQWNQFSISKEEYQEKGYDYIKDHFASNPTSSYQIN